MKNLVTPRSSSPFINPRLELSLATASKDLEACLDAASSTVVNGFCLPPSASPSQVPAAFRDASSGASFVVGAAATAATGGNRVAWQAATEAAIVGTHHHAEGA